MKNYFAFMLCGMYLLSGCGGGVSAPAAIPTLTVAPSSLSFGVAVIATASSEQVETLTNTGTSELVIKAQEINGLNAPDFGQTSTCGSTLDAGASCITNVTFTPSQLGPRSASITITDNGLGSPQVLSLTGVGVDSGANGTLSPTSLTFANQAVGTTSQGQPITLSNYGTTTLSIASVTASTNFGETNTCKSTLASGASCTISVTFAPSNTGNSDGIVAVVDDAPDNPQTVSLSGTGVGGQCSSKGQGCFPGGRECCSGLSCRPLGLGKYICE